MRKSKFSESQITEILNEAEAGLAMAEVASKHGVSAATFYQLRGDLDRFKRRRQAGKCLDVL